MKAVSTRAKDADDIEGIYERIGGRLDLGASKRNRTLQDAGFWRNIA